MPLPTLTTTRRFLAFATIACLVLPSAGQTQSSSEKETLKALKLFEKPRDILAALPESIRKDVAVVAAQAVETSSIDKSSETLEVDLANVKRSDLDVLKPNLLLVKPEEAKRITELLKSLGLDVLPADLFKPREDGLIEIRLPKQDIQGFPAEPMLLRPRKGLAETLTDKDLNRCRAAAKESRKAAQNPASCYGSGNCPTPDVEISYGAFRDSCTTPALGLIGDPTTKAQLSTVALLTYGEGGRPFCGALLLGGRRAVTAAHCFEDPSILSTARLKPVLSDGKSVAFKLSTDPLPSWALFLPDRPVVLDLIETVADVETSVCFLDANAKEELSLFGYLRPSLKAPWTGLKPDNIRTSRFACYSRGEVSKTGRCFEHDCQSDPGVSGAPLFGEVPPGVACKVRVVGLQMTGGGDVGGRCGTVATNGALSASTIPEISGIPSIPTPIPTPSINR